MSCQIVVLWLKRVRSGVASLWTFVCDWSGAPFASAGIDGGMGWEEGWLNGEG